MADSTLPKDELKTRAVEGAPLSQDEVSAIESEETDRTGFGPIKGGPAATAQSIHDKQQAFFQKAGDLARKPVGDITREDAAEVQKAEVRLSFRHLDGGRARALTFFHYRLERWEASPELAPHRLLSSPSLIRIPMRRISDLDAGVNKGLGCPSNCRRCKDW